MNEPTSRRAIVKILGLAAGTSLSAPLSAIFTAVPARGAEAPRLDVNDPAAVAQGYVEHAADVDAREYPVFVSGSSCENCLLLQGSAGNNYRPCSLFPGKLVSVSGWCKGWTAEM